MVIVKLYSSVQTERLLYGIMPKQEDGFNEVVVTVDGKEK